METEADNRNYELAYHLTPDIEEAQVKGRVQELEKFVAQSGGAVLASREPKKKHLSYPIRQKKYAYFGMLDFTGPAEMIEKLNTQMKLQNDILRYLLIVKSDNKELRTLGMVRSRPRMKTHEPTAPSRKDLEQAGKPKEEVKPEQMEKEIEDVLEKI